MARPRFVRRQGPHLRRECIVAGRPVTFFVLLQIRHDELGEFACIANQARNVQVCRRLLSGLGRRGHTHTGRLIRQCDQLFPPYDFVQRDHYLLVARHQLVAGYLVFLEALDNLAIVGGIEPLLRGHQRGQGQHLVADVGERHLPGTDQFFRRGVDAVVPELQFVQFARQGRFLASVGQDGLCDPGIVSGQLIGQHCEVVLVPLQLGAREQAFQALDHDRCTFQVLLDLADERLDQVRYAHPFGQALLGEFGEGLVALGPAGVFLQARQRAPLPFEGNLLVEQAVEAGEDQARQIPVGQDTLVIYGVVLHVVPGGLNHDLDVLQHARILLRREQTVQVFELGLFHRHLAFMEILPQVENFLVIAADPHLTGKLGHELCGHVHYLVGDLVRALDPLRGEIGGVLGECRDRSKNTCDQEGQGCKSGAVAWHVESSVCGCARLHRL